MQGAAVAILVATNSAAVAAVSVASLVIGYGLLAGLWYFVFSPGAERRAERRSRDRREAEAPRPEPVDAPAAPLAGIHEDDPARLRRHVPARRR